MTARARIYRPARTAMQSGKRNARSWVLDYEPAERRTADPLMGWTSSTDMNGQVRLAFETREQAVDYAQRHGIAFEVLSQPEHKRIVRAYADNFAYSRREPWTH